MPNLIINYILMAITFVYACALFCDIYFKAKSIKAKLKLLFLPLSIIIFSTGFLLELSTEGIFIYSLFSCIFTLTGLCFIGYSWFIFASFISFRNGEKSYIFNAVAFIPTILIILLITKPLNNLESIRPYHSFEMHFNSGYFFILALGGVYVFLSNIILLISFLSNPRFSYKHKGTFLLILAFMPISFYVRIQYLKHFELVPLCLLAGYHIILYSASVNYKLFDIVPRSIATIVQNMELSILITNNKNNIVNFNSSFVNSFGSVTSIKESSPLEVFVENLKQSTQSDQESQNIFDSMLNDKDKNISGNIHVLAPLDKWYFVLIQNVMNQKCKKIGKLISFNDITAIHNLNQNLNQKNCELKKINLELKNTNEKILRHTLMSEELAITRERNHILSELHDTIGQSYTSNLALARCVETFLLSNRKEDALGSLEEMASTTKELLFNITSSVNEKDVITRQQSLNDMLKKLFKPYRKSDIAIELKLNADAEKFEYRIRHSIYRICQESINNSLKHGMAKNIYISIEEKDNKITLEIADDGIGCDLVYKGIGLKGIEYRISEIDGKVSFTSDKSRHKGFIVLAEIPIKGDSKL